MENRKTKILAVLCVLLSIGFISTAFAYYQEQTNDVKNTFIAAGSGEMFDFDNEDESKRGVFLLDESKATIGTYGVYSLTSERTKANSYKVLPGVDIPKDPKITIKNKSEIPAYLYLEVVNNCSSYFTFELENCWTLLNGVTGANGGSVYLYEVENKNFLEAIPSLEINIIKDKTLKTLKNITDTESHDLVFYAFLAQTGLDTPSATYNICFKQN